MIEFNPKIIAKIRAEKKLSLQFMAEILGFKNASTYMHYEKGTYSFRAEHLPKIAKALECEVLDFFEEIVAKTATKDAV